MKCPACDKPLATDTDARCRPFCSERCKMADLGGWFSGRYAIPADPDPDAPAEPPEPPEPQKPRQ